jgi:hypothetical protein
MANPGNRHIQNFTSKMGPPTGCFGCSNHNIKRGGERKKRGGRRQRGGGYGFNPAGTPGFGPMPIKTVNDCGTVKPDGLLGKQQYIHSPPPQRGGSRKKGGWRQRGGAGPCNGCGGTPRFSLGKGPITLKGGGAVTNYPEAVPGCNPQCGGTRKRRRKRRRLTKRRKKRRKSRRKRRRRRRRRSRRMRGGYAAFGSDIPSSPGYATPNGGNWLDANPPTYARNDACGTGNCVDNYNHFTGKGAASPITDEGVTPPPPLTKINTPNNKAQCGGKRRRKRRRKGKH